MYAILTRKMVLRRPLVCAAALALLAGAVTGCASRRPEPVTVAFDGVLVRVEVADDPVERSRGLQDHEPLTPGQGMLFVFDGAAPRTFAMKEVAFPIDVVFVGEDGLVSAIEPLSPGDTRLVSSPVPARYVIELPAGWAAERGIRVGSRFQPPE